jgi:hypothetical protein
VSYNVHVAEADVRAGVFLRNDHFALVTRLLKLETDAAISRAIGMDRITISRARDGILGERFIAAVMFLVGQHADELATFGVSVKFEDLFEVSRVKAASA